MTWRDVLRDTSAYGLGYIHGNHYGGAFAVKGARYLDKSFQKMTAIPKYRKSSVKRYPAKQGLKLRFSNKRKQSFEGPVMKKRKTGVRRAKSVSYSKALETSQHNDFSKKHFKVVLRRNKHYKAYGRYMFQELFNSIVNGENEGTQSISQSKFIMTSAQLAGTAPSTNRTGSLAQQSWAINPADLNPYVSSTAGIWPTAVSVANDSFYIHSLEHTLSIVSLSNIPINCKIYWCMAIRDCSFSPSTLWDNCAATEGLGTPVFGTVASTVTTTTTAGYPASSMVGQDPWRYRNFKRFYRKLHAESAVIQAGDQRHFTGHFKINRMVLQRDPQLLQSNVGFLRGTIVPLIICHGGLVHVEDSNTTDELTYGRISYGVVSNNVYTFGAVKNDRVSTVRAFDGLVALGSATHSVPAPGTTWAETIVNDTDQAVLVTSLTN